MNPCVTTGGRPAFVVNVEVFLHRDDRWLLIERGAEESHAPGALGGVGGKVEPPGADRPGVIEDTARREVLEEIGVDLDGVAFLQIRPERVLRHRRRRSGRQRRSGRENAGPGAAVPGVNCGSRRNRVDERG